MIMSVSVLNSMLFGKYRFGMGCTDLALITISIKQHSTLVYEITKSNTRPAYAHLNLVHAHNPRKIRVSDQDT